MRDDTNGFPDWFKPKKYPHIGLPITNLDYHRVKGYVENKLKVASHNFNPFIHKVIIKRKFRPIKSENNKFNRNPSGKRTRLKTIPKARHIYYASHLDSMVFSRYNNILIGKYDDFLRNQPFNSSVVAYRKIPISPGSKKNKCNIDFAMDAFDFIMGKKSCGNLSVIVADVSSFFDNLDHSILKKQWSRILGTRCLPSDHYNVFKALTRLRYVEAKQLFEAYGNTMLVKRGLKNDPKKIEIVRKAINGPQYFKEKNTVAFCSEREFYKNNLNLIIKEDKLAGIPQGSPISALLANVYMIDFDACIFKQVNEIGGFYQRYSDDLIIVVDRSYEEKVLSNVWSSIIDLAKLSINKEKTKLFHFNLVGNVLRSSEVDVVSGKIIKEKPLEYLGFTFCGEKILIKSASFSKFYRNMKGAFRRAEALALYGKNPDKRIFKSKLYKRFTYRGAGRKIRYRPSNEDPKNYIKTKDNNWGNFLSYVFKANEKMLKLNSDSFIRRQSGNAWKKFNTLLNRHGKGNNKM